MNKNKHKKNKKDISISIEKMSEQDLERVKQIEFEGNLSSWSKEDYWQELDRPDSIALVIKSAGEVIGFAIARLIIYNNSVNPNLNISEAELNNICIAASIRNKGIGTLLLEEILNILKAKKVKEIRLEVRESNKAAINFYRKIGFFKKLIRKNYYQTPEENALLMQKKLSLTVSSK